MTGASGSGGSAGLDALALKGKRVLMRVDFNVPQDANGKITDDTRIRAALPTIEEVLAKGARCVVLMSHLGRPKGVDEKLRLAPVAKRLAKLLGQEVQALKESTGPAVEKAVASAPKGSVILLENVRFNAGEQKADPELSKAYARLGDVFVNDAFGTSHRAECSVSEVAKLLPSVAGRLLQAEIEAFQRVLSSPQRPLVAILGGAKVSDKLLVIDNLLDKCDTLLVGGGMAYTFLKALGQGIGKSLCEDERMEVVKAALAKAKKRKVELLLPVDHVVADRFAADANVQVVDTIPDGWMALDIGPKSRKLFAERIAAARTIVWNGPMGVFEMPAFCEGTKTVGQAVAAAQGYTVVGGGDSVAALEQLGLSAKVKHVSTGGGASLELLEGKALPGITSLSTKA
ncbi:MAG: phosphoglycerate kinase [Planctomycetaceae bacterium]|jgi:phosphoglycerate kinase|nr:phosphoglycerate kinase [Planctomycetaceae bacterium]